MAPTKRGFITFLAPRLEPALCPDGAALTAFHRFFSERIKAEEKPSFSRIVPFQRAPFAVGVDRVAGAVNQSHCRDIVVNDNVRRCRVRATAAYNTLDVSPVAVKFCVTEL